MRRCSIVLFALLSWWAGTAQASTEINGLFDARSAGMGGTGVAYLDSAGAIPTNPSLLDQIGKLTITVNAFYIVSQPEAPYTIWHVDTANNQYYRNYETHRSERTSAILPFIGAAYRITDRLVIGAAVYPVIGQGTTARFRPAPDELPDLVVDNKAAMGLVEAGVPLSIRILDNLSVGVMWRVTYMTQEISAPIPTGGAPAGILLNPMRTAAAKGDISVTGMNFTGFQLGVLYRPIPALRIGLTYRSKVAVEGNGTTKTTLGTTLIELDTQQGYTNPHMFRGGLALSLADDRLLLAADFKYLLYAEPFKELKMVNTMANGTVQTKITPLNWKNAYAIQFGAEYKLFESVSLRAGYIAASSATPKEYAISQAAPPGVAHLFGGGVGVRVLDSLNVDLAAAYVVLSSYVDTATEHNAGVGRYSAQTGEFSLSATYHM
jgi:long-subunit fatty acid transport protein